MIDVTTSLPVERHRANVDSITGRFDDDDDDEDRDDQMTSFGSGYYDNDDDDGDAVKDYRDASSVKAPNHDPVHDVWPPDLSSSSSSSSSSHSRPAFHVDDVDSRFDDNQQQSDIHLKDISRTLSTTPRARTRLKELALSPTRRASVERRRPGGLVTSSSSAARRRYYVDNTSTSSATATLSTTFHTLPFLLHCVAAILFSAHVFLPLPVLHASLC